MVQDMAGRSASLAAFAVPKPMSPWAGLRGAGPSFFCERRRESPRWSASRTCHPWRKHPPQRRCAGRRCRGQRERVRSRHNTLSISSVRADRFSIGAYDHPQAARSTAGLSASSSPRSRTTAAGCSGAAAWASSRAGPAKGGVEGKPAAQAIGLTGGMPPRQQHQEPLPLKNSVGLCSAPSFGLQTVL